MTIELCKHTYKKCKLLKYLNSYYSSHKPRNTLFILQHVFSFNSFPISVHIIGVVLSVLVESSDIVSKGFRLIVKWTSANTMSHILFKKRMRHGVSRGPFIRNADYLHPLVSAALSTYAYIHCIHRKWTECNVVFYSK